MKQNPSYYANIPATVRYDPDIPPNAKLLYGEITALCNKEGYCWASNAYFAELYGVSKLTVSQWVKKLADRGHISYEVENRNTRKIFLYGDIEKAKGGYRKTHKGDIEKAEHNNTVNNTKNITVNSKTDVLQAEQWQELIDAFEPVNPLYQDFYKNTTERRALEHLVQTIGYDKLLATIRHLEQITSQRYAPKITKPSELKRDLGRLIAFFRQQAATSNNIVKI